MIKTQSNNIFVEQALDENFPKLSAPTSSPGKLRTLPFGTVGHLVLIGVPILGPGQLSSPSFSLLGLVNVKH